MWPRVAPSARRSPTSDRRSSTEITITSIWSVRRIVAETWRMALTCLTVATRRIIPVDVYPVYAEAQGVLATPTGWK